MKPVKITEIKIYMSRLRKYRGFCAKKRHEYTVGLNSSEIGTHEEFLSTLIHELTHVCLDLVRNRKLTFLLSKSGANEGKDSKVVRVPESKLNKIEEEICQKTERAFLKIFKNYRSDLVR